MRRALAISALVHLAVFMTLFEFRLLPSYSVPFRNGAMPLSVSLALPNVLGQVDLGQQSRVPSAMVAKERRLETKVRATSEGARRQRGPAFNNSHRIERDFSPSTARSEQISGLSQDVEREYRLSLAREVRRMGYRFEPGIRVGYEGSVRMVISYRIGMQVPIVLLDRSSGQSELDELAMHSLSGALARVPLPDAATGMNFRMSFELEYALPR